MWSIDILSRQQGRRAGPLFLLVLFLAPLAYAGGGQYKESSGKAERYFIARGGEVSQVEILLLEYLNRRFPQSKARAQLDAAFVGKPIADGVAPFLRLVDPEFAPPREESIQNVPSPIDRYTLGALYCDYYPLDASYVNLLKNVVLQGNYAATHAALAYQWLQENQCLAPNTIADLHDTVRNGLVDVARSRSGADDIFVEALAMLYYTGLGNEVERAWLDRIVKAQLPNGGWAESKGGNEPSDHTTALAYWVMLEAQKAPAKKERWIRRPSGSK